MAFRRSRRRRSSGVKWFEAFSNPGIINEPTLDVGGLTARVLLRGNAPFQGTASGNRAGEVLSALQTFSHRRTVGELFVAWTPTVQVVNTKIITVHCGLAVLEVDESGTPTNLDRWNPSAMDASDLPWMWQRRYRYPIPAGFAVGDVLTNNFESPILGDWVDVKINRFMKRETDYFLIMTSIQNEFISGNWGAATVPSGLRSSVGVNLRLLMKPVMRG